MQPKYRLHFFCFYFILILSRMEDKMKKRMMICLAVLIIVAMLAITGVMLYNKNLDNDKNDDNSNKRVYFNTAYNLCRTITGTFTIKNRERFFVSTFKNRFE